jgi:xylulokinase
VEKLIAGVDSSTQSVKIVVRKATSGELVALAKAPHPDGTEVDPESWWLALQQVIKDIGGLEKISAISIAGQQHGMVALDSQGKVIRPALLWNDTRSASAADELNSELPEISKQVGSSMVAAFTASKIRWLAKNERENSKKVAAFCLPHDYLSWRLSGSKNLEDLVTDRSDASGTGYFDSVNNKYVEEILRLAHLSDNEIILPKVLAPNESVLKTVNGTRIGPGAGDNAAAALGVGARLGDVVVSLGTSGTAFSVSKTPTFDQAGEVAGFSDATGNYLPLVCTLNAARILDSANNILNSDYEQLSELALQAAPGAGGLSLLPYFEGERTPNRPTATGVLSGLTLANATRSNIARAMIEGMLCGLADAIAALEKNGVSINRVLLVGGGAKSTAVSKIASQIFGREVLVPEPGEYVADGAAKQAAWVETGSLPEWKLGEVKKYKEAPSPQVLIRYQELRDRTESW